MLAMLRLAFCTRSKRLRLLHVLLTRVVLADKANVTEDNRLKIMKPMVNDKTTGRR
jgi:hypothetical protein